MKKQKQASRPKKNIYKVPKLKNEIKNFLLSEEGKITKNNILKTGLLLTALNAMLTPEEGLSQVHVNGFFDGPNASGGLGGHTSHTSHSSHGSHGAHGSHGSHGAGWC